MQTLPARYAITWAGCPEPTGSDADLLMHVLLEGKSLADLNIPGVVHSATVDGILQQPPQLVPVRLTISTICSYNICTASDVTKIEVIEACPALHVCANAPCRLGLPVPVSFAWPFSINSQHSTTLRHK